MQTQRLLLGAAVLVLVAGVGIGATRSYFSDTETSTGNQFTAGNIDLQIDNESYAPYYVVDGAQAPEDPGPAGPLVASQGTSWVMKDIVAGAEKFFDFSDLKPGDLGEDTISVHVGSNDAWVCAAARLTSNSDMDCTEPEITDEENDIQKVCTPENIPGNHGDLASQLNFAFWKDDGDNVFEIGDAPDATDGKTDGSVFLHGSLSDLNNAGQIALADSQGGIDGANNPIPGGDTFYIGKVWCFGELAQDPVVQDGYGKTGSNGPLDRGTGWTCNGAPIDNIAQTDEVQGDMQFYAVQARNNPGFLCSSDYQPEWDPNVPTVATPTDDNV